MTHPVSNHGFRIKNEVGIANKEQRDQKARVEAKDTVKGLSDLIVMTTDIEIMALSSRNEGIKALRDHLLSQAEITWSIAKQAGIREGIQLANEVGLDHFIDNFITGEHHPTCEACKLLKEWGIE